MKKILLLSDDLEFGINLSAALYRFNFRVVRTLTSDDEVINDFYQGGRYDLYIFDMKARDLNLKIVKTLRDNQNFTPIMLILDEALPDIFKKIYYAKVDDFIVKPFLIDMILFHIFKQTKVLLGTKFELKNGIVFDKTSLSVKFDDKEVFLGKKRGIIFRNFG